MGAVLEDEAPFALIAKPCDVGAIRRLARLDARVGRQLRYAHGRGGDSRCIARRCARAWWSKAALSFRDLDGFQPHQVRKKRAVWARHAGMRAAGMAVPEADGLRLPDCARLNGWTENLDEARGARRRARTGALGEPPARGRMEDAARTAQPAKD